MFTKEDEIFKHLKARTIISVWMSAGPERENHAEQAYLVFGFGCGPKMYKTPKFRDTLGDAPLISVFAQERQECLMISADGSSTEVKANMVHAGVDLMTRLLGPEDNDWRVHGHSLGPVSQAPQGQAAQGAPAIPNFDSVLELANVPNASPPLQIVNESTIIGRPRQEQDAGVQPRDEPNIIVWDDSDVIKGPDGNDVLNPQHVLYPEDLDNRNPTKKVLIYQMHAPLWFGTLWDRVLENLGRNDLTIIIVINADDLRSDGIRISRGISWEKTMEDFQKRMDRINAKMIESFQGNAAAKKGGVDILQNVHLLVRCGYEGVLHQRPTLDHPRPFVFHMVPNMAEGEVLRPYHGRMSGIHMAFVTGLAASLARQPDISPEAMGRTNIGAAIELAIIWSHRFASAGFFKEPNGTLNFPKAKSLNNYQTSKTKVIYADEGMILPNGQWSLFNLLHTGRESVAAQVVKYGTKRIQASVPTAQYGPIRTADRIEIEGYRSTAAVVHEYLSGKAPNPMSIAVFGQPGAGKSFGVKKVIEAVLKDCGKNSEPIEANLSQFQEYSNLVGVFHKVRDTALKGQLPVVLFDEFDSEFGGRALGWLKYFLAPMQDGTFLDSGSVRPLGRAIFIFIGGTSSTFKNFDQPPLPRQDDENPPGGQNNPPARRRPTAEERQVKKPDFVSRLSAHIDVRGPNQNEDGNDEMYIIRRAIILQNLLERRFGVGVGDIKVDDTVLNAFLRHERFPHGTRSIELILQMSRLSGLRRFESSDLPSDDQLSMHVGDIAAFSGLIDSEPIDMARIRPIDVSLNNKWMWARRPDDRVED
ncbi:hypothetical protein N0V84_005763 [Fusarium piperis]|uniref:ATPase AAA-type core domain-containing protein n=1 Tax=Fusarium piperis TaxID=1435070 RepID=A0A9W8WD98_9HYPO|nr:hypothetical protein N0V84_005763 [Fusarium piperis]